MRTNAGNLKKGEYLLHEGKIWQVAKTEFSFQGRGMAVMRTKIKNVESGKNIDVTYKTTESVETADIEVKDMQFLYKDGKNLFFMDTDTYNQISLPEHVVGSIAQFFKEGKKYYVLLHNNIALNVRPPASVKLKVTATQQGVKGDTVSQAKKQATLETGVSVMVPLFIKQGDMIAINPETGAYVERVKE
ncbi:elongation factor P [Candidatus Roizmanbacteria bacterium RIFCSPHIGHO2_12_41_18]|nr:MAG: elongation factor P [Candidatus Roizmanbacteria bacterium RIFCSPHIGHO2_12_41_18]